MEHFPAEILGLVLCRLDILSIHCLRSLSRRFLSLLPIDLSSFEGATTEVNGWQMISNDCPWPRRLTLAVGESCSYALSSLSRNEIVNENAEGESLESARTAYFSCPIAQFEVDRSWTSERLFHALESKMTPWNLAVSKRLSIESFTLRCGSCKAVLTEPLTLDPFCVGISNSDEDNKKTGRERPDMYTSALFSVRKGQYRYSANVTCPTFKLSNIVLDCANPYVTNCKVLEYGGGCCGESCSSVGCGECSNEVANRSDDCCGYVGYTFYLDKLLDEDGLRQCVQLHLASRDNIVSF